MNDLDRDTLRSKREIENPTHSKRIDIINARTEWLKVWGSVLGIVGAIVASFFAYFRPEEDSGAKDVYKELSTVIREISQDQVQLQKDVAALQGYLEGRHLAERKLAEDKREIADNTPTVRVPSSIRMGVGIAKPAPVVLLPPEELLKKPAPPEIRSTPRAYNPPPVDSVVKK